jgi:glycine cleavage system aminomethyltransferase T
VVRPSASGRAELVGLTSPDPIPEGAMLIARDGAPVEGHVTSATRSVLGEDYIALALLKDGRARAGESILASSPTRGQHAQVTIGDPLFYDPEGARYRD